MKLNDLDLLKLQTQLMRQDNTTKALCSALSPQLREVASDVAKCLLLSRVQELPEAVLDELAVELRMDWYDANASIDVKRELIRNSDKVRRYLGTPYAVEQVVQDFFGDGQVEEWFDYDGQPFYFRVVTVNTSVTGELANQFAQAVEKVKNARSRLEAVVISMSAELAVYFGGIVQTGDYYTVEQVVSQ